ncbi:MAG TPA: hypothetical protein DCW90_20185 [Lachnospiraceae bacterium]|nr:hypothetical protein [Lachnospiraceae bacterium]
MDNPCKHCDKANIHYVNDCEYGCDKPCQKAKDFYKSLGNELDEILKKLHELIEKMERENE